MLKEFTLKDALLYALFIHVLLMILFASKPLKHLDLSFFSIDKPFIELRTPPSQPISFRFLDVPGSIPEQSPINPDTEYTSDRASRAQGEGQPDKKPDSIKPEPFSTGNTQHAAIPSKTGGSPKPKPDSEKKANEIAEQKKPVTEPFPDGSVLVRSRENSGKDKKTDQAGPINFLDAAKNVGDYLQRDKSANPDGDLGGVALSFDVNFNEFGWYAKIIFRRIRGNWFPTLRSAILRETGTTDVVFYIERNGQVTNLQILRPSGSKQLDNAALNAVKSSDPFPELPEKFPNPRLGVRISFEVHD